MEDKKHICECCGQKMRFPQKQSLTRGLVDTLIIFANVAIRKGENHIHALKECGFDVNRATNFQKLKFFGLVAKHEENGYWVLTTKGKEFLNGNISISRHVVTFNNKVIESSEEQISFKTAKKSEVYWQTEFNLSIEDYKVFNL